MKTNQRSASCIASALLTLVLLAAFARADTFTATFTNGFGDAIWTRDAVIGVSPDPGQPGNWSTGAYPSNGHSILDPNPPVHNVPGDNPLYDVVINIATPCTLTVNTGNNVVVQSVALGSISTLNIVSPRVLTVTPGGTVNNQGVINLAGDLSFPSGGVTLTGGGTINFNLGRFILPGPVTNVNNTIQGKTIGTSGNGLGSGQTTLVNQANGVIDANISGQPLLVEPGGVGGLTNTGLMQASNGGILEVFGNSSVPITNTGGTIQALTGSEVQLYTSSPGITGGTLTTSGTGVIRVAAATTVFLTDVTNSGTFIADDNTSTHVAGTINNTGSISLNATVNVADMLLNGNVTLTGGGTINMTNGARIILAGTFTNANNIIQGETNPFSGGLGSGQTTIVNQAAGLVDANVSGRPFLVEPAGVGGLTNAGVMQASNGGILIVSAGSSVPITNTGGTIQALTGSEVQLATSAPGITGGTLTTSGTGVIRLPASTTVFLTDVTNSGTFIADNNSITRAAGTINDTGTMTFEGSSFLQFSTATTALAGNGAVVLTNNAIMYISGQAVTNGAGHIIKGNGTILIDGGGSFTNNGIVSPGLSPGKLTVSGSYTQGSTGVLNLEIGGHTPVTQYDQLAVTGNAALSGTLNVSLINGFVPAVGDVFQIITTGSFSGAFATINTSGFTAQVNYSASSITMTVLTVGAGTPTPTPAATPSKLLNISTRMRVQTGENVLIGGFIITGTDPKQVIIRAIGPSLSSFPDALSDPTLELFQGSTLLASNDNWRVPSQNESDVLATGIPPTNDLESALVRTLLPGAYTAIVRGNGGVSGIGLVEAYDLAQGANSKLANISTRGFVETGSNVMIGGLIIGPAGGSNARVVVRAIGPSLAGIPGALQDPALELKDANGSTLISNDDWQQGQPTEIQEVGLAPTDTRESALLATLPPSNYTAIVRGAGNTTGVGLVEVYHLQ